MRWFVARKIREKVDTKELLVDLETYRQLAVEKLGASDAKII